MRQSLRKDVGRFELKAFCNWDQSSVRGKSFSREVSYPPNFSNKSSWLGSENILVWVLKDGLFNLSELILFFLSWRLNLFSNGIPKSFESALLPWRRNVLRLLWRLEANNVFYHISASQGLNELIQLHLLTLELFPLEFLREVSFTGLELRLELRVPFFRLLYIEMVLRDVWALLTKWIWSIRIHIRLVNLGRRLDPLVLLFLLLFFTRFFRGDTFLSFFRQLHFTLGFTDSSLDLHWIFRRRFLFLNLLIFSSWHDVRPFLLIWGESFLLSESIQKGEARRTFFFIVWSFLSGLFFLLFLRFFIAMNLV